MSDRLKDFALQIADEQLVAMRAEIVRLRGDAEVSRLRLEAAHAEIGRLNEAIRRLADQDATLSVQGNNVTVTMDATLTEEELEAVKAAIDFCEYLANPLPSSEQIAALRKMLERLG